MQEESQRSGDTGQDVGVSAEVVWAQDTSGGAALRSHERAENSTSATCLRGDDEDDELEL